MAEILSLRDPHEQTQMLLPWRANGTLEPGDAALVEAHLATCAECRADLDTELSLKSYYASVRAAELSRPPRKLAQGWLPGSGVAFLRRRITVGWALAGQAAVAAAAALVFFSVPAPAPRGNYQLLGYPGSSQQGNAIVLFAPEMRARDLQAALGYAGARVVSGPTASGAFVIRVDGASREAALKTLRSTDDVLLAEPIDAANGP